MKKLVLTLASVLLLSGCMAQEPVQVVEPKENEPVAAVVEEAMQPVVRYEQGLPTVYPAGESNFTTYLMMSPYGSIVIPGQEAPVKGVVSEKFYENTIVWKAEPGTTLPGKDEVISSVSGATFRGWAYYDEDNDHVFPDYYTTVPAKEGLALKAIFDGADAGGSGGGGGGSTPVTPGENVTFSITGFEDWVPNDGAAVFAWAWGGGAGNGAWFTVTLQYQGTDNTFNNVTGTFQAPDNITGFNLARCSHGTTSPDWTVVGNAAGRVYNKTSDVQVSSGVRTYSAPRFVEYEYNPQ